MEEKTPEQIAKQEHAVRDVMWWATLVVTVLAIPAVGFIALALLPVKGMMAVAVLMIICWLCTYLGMRLMQHPKMSEKIDLNKK